MENEQASSGGSDYVDWKGWVDQTPFGLLTPGEAAYFGSELRDLRLDSGPIADVLEIGYGNGTFLAYCRKRGWNVTGTELDAALVQAGTDAGFAVLAADRLASLTDRSFDLIAVFDVLEHIPAEAVPGFLSSLAGKLRDGGRIIFRFPNADSWLGNPLQNGDPTHVSAIGYLKMTYFALQAGLELVSFRGAKRHGFATSFVNGVYSLIAGPIIAAIAAVTRVLYFPGLPVVLSTSNVVCIVRKASGPPRKLPAH